MRVSNSSGVAIPGGTSVVIFILGGCAKAAGTSVASIKTASVRVSTDLSFIVFSP